MGYSHIDGAVVHAEHCLVAVTVPNTVPNNLMTTKSLASVHPISQALS